MHTAMVIAGGIGLLAQFVLITWFMGGTSPDFALAVRIFIPAWLALSLVNFWMGVSAAGYPLRRELLTFLLVFLVPAALAVGGMWRWVY